MCCCLAFASNIWDSEAFSADINVSQTFVQTFNTFTTFEFSPSINLNESLDDTYFQSGCSLLTTDDSLCVGQLLPAALILRHGGGGISGLTYTENGGLAIVVGAEVTSAPLTAGSIVVVSYTDVTDGLRTFTFDVASDGRHFGPVATANGFTVTTVLVDTTAPTLTSFTRKPPATSPTNADTLVFLATFSEDVVNVGTNDFSVNGSTATISVAPVTASTYDITVSGGDLASLNGTVGLDVVAAPTVADTAGNALATGEPGTDETYTLENTAPTLTSFTRKPPATSPTNADTLVFLATFSEDVVNVGTNDFSVNGSTATISVAPVTASTYDITVSGGDLASLNGTVGLDVVAAPTVADTAGNALATGEPGTDETYTLENTAPTLTSFTRKPPATSPTNADTLVFLATFSEDVVNVGTNDFSVNGSTATISVAPVTASTYDITVSGGDLASLNGTVGLDVVAAPTVADTAGNALATGEPGTDETYTLENTAPTLTSFTRKPPATSPTNADTLVFLATFSEDVVNVGTNDFSVNGSTATISVAPVTASTYDITVSGGDLASLNGTVGLDVVAAPTVADTAGNALATGEPGTDETYTLENTAPTLTSFTRKPPATSPTNADTLVFLATFSEDVVNVGTNDFSVNGSTATISVAPVTASTYDITVSGGDLASLNGTVGLDVVAAPTVADTAGNALATGEPGTDETYTLENTAPTLTSFTRKPPATSPTNADTLVFLATFSEDVVNVGTNDFFRQWQHSDNLRRPGDGLDL